MSGLYDLDNPIVKDFAEKLGKMPKNKLTRYAKDLMSVPTPGYDYSLPLKEALKILKSKDSSSAAALNEAVCLIAGAEYSRLYGLPSEVAEEATEKLMVKYGRMTEKERQKNEEFRKKEYIPIRAWL